LVRYLLYLKNHKFRPSDASLLLQQARTNILKPGDLIIRDVRVARRFIEFDVGLVGEERLHRIIPNVFSTIAEFESYEKVEEKNISKEEAVDYARNLFNKEKFWKCHEILEGVWKQAEGEEKMLLNGIILIAAALVHFQKGENEICLGILKRAHDKIKSGKGEYYGIQLSSLEENLKKIIYSKTITPLKL
jgi:uncharacterized protein